MFTQRYIFRPGSISTIIMALHQATIPTIQKHVATTPGNVTHIQHLCNAVNWKKKRKIVASSQLGTVMHDTKHAIAANILPYSIWHWPVVNLLNTEKFMIAINCITMSVFVRYALLLLYHQCCVRDKLFCLIVSWSKEELEEVNILSWSWFNNWFEPIR